MAFGLTPAGTITKEQTRLSTKRLPVKTGVNIAKGNVCFVNTSGWVDIAATGTSAGSEWFVALEPANNTSGTNGAISVPLAQKGHFVTVVAAGAIYPGTPVKMHSVAGQVVAFVAGTDAEGLKVGIYQGKEGGTIAKSGSTPYLESYTDSENFVPVVCAATDVIEVLLR
jgi:hypothetical protein